IERPVPINSAATARPSSPPPTTMAIASLMGQPPLPGRDPPYASLFALASNFAVKSQISAFGSPSPKCFHKQVTIPPHGFLRSALSRRGGPLASGYAHRQDPAAEPGLRPHARRRGERR